MQDLYHKIKATKTIIPAVQTATVTGTGVDLAGFESAVAFIHMGSLTDGTHTPKLQESSDNVNWTDVIAGGGGQLGSFTALVANTGQAVGYINGQRYLRVLVTVSGAASGGLYGATIVAGDARHQPVTSVQAP